MAASRARTVFGKDGLAGKMRRLSSARQEMIRPVLERPREHVLLSLRDMANALHSAPATLLRAIRGLGFPSYYDFRRYLHDLALSQSTSLDVIERSPRTHGQASLDQDLRNLQALRNTLDWKRVLALTKRIYAARRIVIIGGDMAKNLVGLLDYELALLGFNCVSAITAGEILHRVRHLGRKDLVIAFSFRRGLRQTVEGLKQARGKGAYCVGITDTLVSPIARYSQECFVTPTEGVSFAWSYVAPAAFINVLMVACANYRRARTVVILKETANEQRSGFRWYPGEV